MKLLYCNTLNFCCCKILYLYSVHVHSTQYVVMQLFIEHHGMNAMVERWIASVALEVFWLELGVANSLLQREDRATTNSYSSYSTPVQIR